MSDGWARARAAGHKGAGKGGTAPAAGRIFPSRSGTPWSGTAEGARGRTADGRRPTTEAAGPRPRGQRRGRGGGGWGGGVGGGGGGGGRGAGLPPPGGAGPPPPPPPPAPGGGRGS